MSVNTKEQSGFTLVELNLSIVLIGIILISVFSVFTNYFVLLTRNNTDLTLSVDSQALLRVITEELRYGAGIRQTNSIVDANSPAGGWNTSNTSFVIITALPAINNAEEYIINPSTGKPYLNELVYYKTGSTMHKRTLAHPSATGNKIRTSCPASLASPACPSDVRLINNVESMVFVLYDQDNAATSDPLIARSIEINLSMQKDTFGQPLQLSNSIRTTLRNTF